MFTLIAAVARYALLCPCIYSVLFSNAFYIMDKIHLYIYRGGLFLLLFSSFGERERMHLKKYLYHRCARIQFGKVNGIRWNKMKMRMFKEIRLSIYATNRVGKCSRSLELCKAHTTQLTMNRIQLNSDSASWWCVRVVCVYQLHIGLSLWGNARVR